MNSSERRDGSQVKRADHFLRHHIRIVGPEDMLQKALRLDLADWHYLAIAVSDLLMARVSHATTSVDRLIEGLRESEEEPGHRRAVSGSEPLDIKKLSWAIGAAAHRVPWRSDCLIQAIAAHRCLRRYGLRSDFFLGVGKDEAGGFTAHAWLCCGDEVVTGGQHDRFATLIGPETDLSAWVEHRRR